MKYMGVLISSIVVFLAITFNLYYNSITLDMQKMKDHILEVNIIYEDITQKEKEVSSEKEDYISRLMTLKSGIENSKTSFLVHDYKEYKLKSVESMIQALVEENQRDKYLEDVNKYNELSERELDELINKNIMEVTYISTQTYI